MSFRWALLAMLLSAPPATGAVLPKPGPADPRMQRVDYNPDDVVRLAGRIGYQLMIEFGPDERIENVSIGDGQAWQVTPNRRANLLFLKPLDPLAETNMTVVTDVRRYAFELVVLGDGPEVPYVVRFQYAAPAPPRPPGLPGPETRNTAYLLKGAKAAWPAEVFDDGRATYFRWAEGAALPAIFHVDADRRESLVNFVLRDGYVVVEQVAQGFVLRNGTHVARVVNRRATGALP